MSFEAGRSGEWWVEGWGESDRATGYQIRQGRTFVRWDRFAGALSSEPDLRRALTQSLAQSEDGAFFWECNPRPAEGDAPMSFVLVDAPALAKLTPSSAAFATHLEAADGPVTTFPNLGGDALLVVPAPEGRTDAYTHLADFVRRAPPAQVDALWVAVGGALEQWRRRERGRVWLSTSGLGVPWVHVRLDSRPKYYVHAPFARA